MALAQTTQSGPIGFQGAQSALPRWASQHSPILLLGLVLVLLPAVAGEFVLTQIVGWALVLGMIALSLTFLAGYGGMVSLVQMTVASVAGYTITVLGASSMPYDQPVLAVVGGGAGGNRDRCRLRNAFPAPSPPAPRASIRS